MYVMRSLGVLAAFSIFACNAALAQSPLPPGSAPNAGLTITQVFSQYNYYNTDSDKRTLRYKYRAEGFSSGASFRYGEKIAGFVYGGFMAAEDDVFTPVASRTDYDLPQFGGQLSYALSPNLSYGGSILLQRIDGDFASEAIIGPTDGWGIAGGLFAQVSLPLRQMYIDITPRIDASRNSIDQPGLTSTFDGSGIMASLGIGLRYIMTSDWTVGASATPTWVVQESDELDERETGPFYATFSGQTRFRINGPLWLYGSYNYRIHDSDRDAQSAVVGLAWTIGP